MAKWDAIVKQERRGRGNACLNSWAQGGLLTVADGDHVGDDFLAVRFHGVEMVECDLAGDLGHGVEVIREDDLLQLVDDHDGARR